MSKTTEQTPPEPVVLVPFGLLQQNSFATQWRLNHKFTANFFHTWGYKFKIDKCNRLTT